VLEVVAPSGKKIAHSSILPNAQLRKSLLISATFLLAHRLPSTPEPVEASLSGSPSELAKQRKCSEEIAKER
jgi:hypothetical protein